MKKNNFISKNLLLLTGVISVALVSAGLYYTRASFVEPTFAPSTSDQDFTENIMGTNNVNNDFDSSNVNSNKDGSLVERLEYMASIYLEPPALIDYSNFKNQIWDDWKGSAVSTSSDLASAYAGAVDMNKEEGTWASTTDTSLGSETIASGVVKQDTRTGLYWSDCYSLAQDGVCDTITDDFDLDGVIGDTDDGLDAEGGDSVDFCEALSLDMDADGTDETDWYLPGQKELMVAYVNGAANNIPNPAYYYWSSTEVYNNVSYAWFVYLFSGYTNGNSKTNNYYARCVCR
jgi:hypothetical protein